MLTRKIAILALGAAIAFGSTGCTQLALSAEQNKAFGAQDAAASAHRSALKASVSELQTAGRQALSSGRTLSEVADNFNSTADGIVATAASDSILTVRGHKSMTEDNLYTINFADGGAGVTVSTAP